MYKRLISLQLCTAATIGILTCLGSLPTAAQSSQPSDPLQDLQRQDDANDPNQVFTNRGGTGSLLNLMNRLQQVNSRSDSEFAEDQSTSFDSAVDGFRKKQQEQLGNPAPVAPKSTDTIESTP